MGLGSRPPQRIRGFLTASTPKTAVPSRPSTGRRITPLEAAGPWTETAITVKRYCRGMTDRGDDGESDRPSPTDLDFDTHSRAPVSLTFLTEASYHQGLRLYPVAVFPALQTPALQVPPGTKHEPLPLGQDDSKREGGRSLSGLT